MKIPVSLCIMFWCAVASAEVPSGKDMGDISISDGELEKVIQPYEGMSPEEYYQYKLSEALTSVGFFDFDFRRGTMLYVLRPLRGEEAQLLRLLFWARETEPNLR